MDSDLLWFCASFAVLLFWLRYKARRREQAEREGLKSYICRITCAQNAKDEVK